MKWLGKTIGRRLAKRAGAVLLAAALLAGPVSGCAPQGDENARFDTLTRELFVNAISDSWLDVHYTLQDPAAYGIRDVPAVLYRFETDKAAAQEKELDKTRKELQSFRYDELTADRQLDYDVLAWYLDAQQAFEGLSLYEEPLTDTGIHAQLPILLAEYHLATHNDVQDYFALLEDVGPMFASLLGFEQERAKQGLFMADSSADSVIQVLEDFADSGEENILVLTFEDRLAELPQAPTKAQREDYIRRNQAGVEKMAEAYRGLAKGLGALKGAGKKQGGLCLLPKGKAYYEALVKLSTGASMGPDEMAKWLDDHRIKCENELDSFYTNQAGRTDAQMEEWAYADIEMAEPEAMLKDLQTAIKDDFPQPGKVAYQVKTVHPAMQESLSPAFFLTPQLDNETENAIYMNPLYLESDSNLGLYTTLAHEGLAGHLYQNSYYTQHITTPLRAVLDFNGYIEGWATYAEMQAYGFAPGLAEEAALLQRINRETALNLYARADIGVHYQGWTKEKLADFCRQMGVDAASAAVMYEAVINDPANYLSYGAGYFSFKELREYAEQKLGAAFSPQEFHTVLLRTGPAPFAVLQEQVEQYVERAQAQAA